ncbi:hypothetical protein C2G38_2116592 [Gigaspora rosea]|uniref:Uncharacterized protein n=1 Tax=Gigaspora rosea TaxID=44941 RepID=A0A397U939_9GLOM|nr:hypothetical protein C2G38_2116592 [Gigaspora rosea]
MSKKMLSNHIHLYYQKEFYFPPLPFCLCCTFFLNLFNYFMFIDRSAFTFRFFRPVHIFFQLFHVVTKSIFNFRFFHPSFMSKQTC